MIHLEIAEIKGDGKTKNYEDYIDCESMSWACANTADANTADGLTSSTSSVEQITFTSPFGLQSLNLFSAALISKHLPKCILHFTKTVGSNVVKEWLTITMENCVIASDSIGIGEEDMGADEFTIAFEKFKAEYFMFDVTGKETPGPELEYNIQTRELS